MANLNNRYLRQIHSRLAPIMILPLLITLITGSLFQVAILTGNVTDFLWLLKWHKGNFGIVNLEIVYPFLNSFGLLLLAVTGINLWLKKK